MRVSSGSLHGPDRASTSPARHLGGHHDRQVALDRGEARQRLYADDRRRQRRRARSARARPRRRAPAGRRPRARRAPARRTSPPARPSTTSRGGPPLLEIARRLRPRPTASSPRRAAPAAASTSSAMPLASYTSTRSRAARASARRRAQPGQRDAEPQLLVRGAIAVLGADAARRRCRPRRACTSGVWRLTLIASTSRRPGEQRGAQHRALRARAGSGASISAAASPQPMALEPVGIDEGVGDALGEPAAFSAPAHRAGQAQPGAAA